MRAVFNDLSYAKLNPVFGKIKDYYWRTEYQTSGAPHVHYTLWVESVQVARKSSLDEVTRNIDSFTTCHFLYKLSSPILHKLIVNHQMHRCSKYCQGKFKRNSGLWISDYRFGIPHSSKSSIIGHIGSKLPNYITDCMTKGEKLEIDETWEEVNNPYKELGRWVTSFIFKSVVKWLQFPQFG